MSHFKLTVAVFFGIQLLCLQAFALEVGDSVQFYGAKGLVVATEDTFPGDFVQVKFDNFEELLIAPSAFFESQNEVPFDGFIGTTVVEASLEKFFQSKKLGPVMMTPFKGYLLPIRVMRGALGVDVFIDSAGHRPIVSCLAMQIDLLAKTSHVARILAQWGNAPVSCPLPLSRRGTLLLELVDALSTSLRLEKVTLIDSSKKACEANKKETSLNLLRIIQKGAGWYESHGYLTDNHKEYREGVKTFLNFPIRALEEEIDLWGTIYPGDLKSYLESHPPLQRSSGDLEVYLADFPGNAELFNNSLRAYRRYLKLFENNRHSDSVSEFLSWLWDTDCATYTTLVDEFLEQPASRSLFEFSSLRPVSKLLVKLKPGLKR